MYIKHMKRHFTEKQYIYDKKAHEIMFDISYKGNTN